jgi:hypothetical protein
VQLIIKHVHQQKAEASCRSLKKSHLLLKYYILIVFRGLCRSMFLVLGLSCEMRFIFLEFQSKRLSELSEVIVNPSLSPIFMKHCNLKKSAYTVSVSINFLG